MPIPTRLSQLVPYLTAHAAIYKNAPASFGLSASTANDLDTKAKALATAYQEALDAREKSKGATVVQNQALSSAASAFAAVVESIRGFASASADPAAVLAAAQIDPIAPPSPVGPPGPVSNIAVGIDIASGNLLLSWKASNPGGSGTSYIIARRLPGATTFSFLGTATASGPMGKRYTDTTLPAGTDFVEYSITPLRSGLSGPAVTAMVRFGTVGGQQVASITSTTPVKMAA